jgi:NADH-quinone oxidoreductase subunit L
MLEMIWLVPALPLAGFLLLILFGGRLSHGSIAVIGTGSIGLSAAIITVAGISFLVSLPPGSAFVETFGPWIDAGGFTSQFALYLDPLSLVMGLVILWVAFLIHLYSVRYMGDEEGFSRFFAYMNLFVGSMVILILADNLLFLYLGWEGVGLCSYLLIGFWYKDPANNRAAMKAFIVTRVGDGAMAIGLFLAFNSLGTLNIPELMESAAVEWPVGSPLAVAVAALLLFGALGKSAQMPLQTWLPDAMAGPTPVSALLHAATMVTAGVYLIARMHLLFVLAPAVLEAVAVIGALTLLMAALAALAQKDIKRVLAYSTMSQVGYMFLALGVGAWSAGIFHFMTHAFFKALLFLAAGLVIRAFDGEHDISKMGGLKKTLPLVFFTFLIGGGSLSAIPLITAGFYSKDLIVYLSYASVRGGPWLGLVALAGAFLTSLYTFRLLFLVFFGKTERKAEEKPGLSVKIPLLVLAILSICGGFIQMPAVLAKVSLFTDFVDSVLPTAEIVPAGPPTEGWALLLSSLVSISGIYAAYILYLRRPWLRERLAGTYYGQAIYRFFGSGWGFDRLYDALLVRPFIALARANRDDAVDLLYDAVAWCAMVANGVLVLTQSGRVRWYVLVLAGGGVLFIGMVIFL